MNNGPSPKLSVELLDSIRDVGRGEWDALAGDVYISHGWLRVLEESFLDNIEHVYFLARVEGRLVGATASHVHHPSGEVFTIDDSVFGRLKRAASKLGLSMLPSLICGPSRAYGQHMIFDPSLDSDLRRRVASVLLNSIEEVAERRKLPISFNNVMAQEPELVGLLEKHGFARTVNFPLNYVEVKWESPDDYRRFLSRRKLTREINKNQREGVEIQRLEEVEPLAHRLHELLNENFVKYNGKPLPVKSNFVTLCKRYLGPESIVYIARKHGRIVGTIVMFRRDDTAYLTDVGVDHEATGNDFTYFNLSYYRPISDAIEMGIERIYYGTMMYSMKADRGCETVDIHLYHRPARPFLRRLFIPLFAAHRAFKTWFIKRQYF